MNRENIGEFAAEHYSAHRASADDLKRKARDWRSAVDEMHSAYDTEARRGDFGEFTRSSILERNIAKSIGPAYDQAREDYKKTLASNEQHFQENQAAYHDQAVADAQAAGVELKLNQHQ